MAFQPQVPIGGVAGWRYLQRTQDTQQAAFNKGHELNREIAYFKENIGAVKSAEDLIADRRLLNFSLTAFGLEDSVNYKALVRKVLEEGTESRDAFANKINNTAQKNLAKAFGFGNASGAQTHKASFVADVVERFKDRQFEQALGTTNPDMESALAFRREIGALAEGGGSWYSVIGSRTLSSVFQKAFNLPPEVGALDIDRQVEIYKEKTRAMFGSDDLGMFRDGETVAKMTDRFLSMSQLQGGGLVQVGQSPALSLLQGAGAVGSAGILNLLYS